LKKGIRHGRSGILSTHAHITPRHGPDHFRMKYWSQAIQSRAAKSGEDAYRALAEKAVSAQQDNATALSAIQADVAKLSGSLSTVETILKQVG
jgi:hypothetical protein